MAFCIVFAIVSVTLLLKFCHINLPNISGTYVFVFWIIIVLISLYTAAKEPSVTNISFDAPNIKQDVKIAFVADTHFGATVGLNRAKNLKQIIENNKPNLIVFAGDIFETDFENSLPFAKVLAETLPNKKYGVLGNHEYYQGLGNERKSFKAAEITLLENKSEVFENINIIGVNDIKTAGISAKEFSNILQKEIKPDSFNLLLSHTPLYFKEASNAGVNLMLSGHTHKGQIWPFNFLVKAVFPYFNGEYKEGNASLYVTSGTFFWGPPIRFLSNNEIVFITLKGAKK
ncbi:MAG: metallophosphoesterase [Elusimicrobiaceae bacterium]|nr:metallophosphoesterase [Elusimicrobiaceae bacterium]